ncbi:unnamed protein product [Closterium sp. Naga37s-1]|nr:unnamed protein product [Closterium sp. Naga37s-1]
MASPEHEHFHDIQVPCSSTASFLVSPAQLPDSLRRDASPAVETIYEQDSKPTPKASPGFMRRLFKDRPEEEPKEPSFFSLNAAATKSPKGSHVPVVDAPLPQKQSALRSLFSTPTFFASGATKAKEMAGEGGEEVPPSFADQFASRMGSLRSFSGGWTSEHALPTCNKPAIESVATDCQPDTREDNGAEAEPPVTSAETAVPLESCKNVDSDAAPLTSAGVDDASLLTAGVVMEKACPSPSFHKQPAPTSSPWSLRAEGLFSALKGGVKSSPNPSGTPLGRGATEGVSIIDIGASASPQTDDSLEGLYGAPKLPKHPSFSIRKSTVLATLDFVKALGDISFGLVDVFPNEDRQTALGESLAELNAHLAGMPANEGVLQSGEAAGGRGCAHELAGQSALHAAARSPQLPPLEVSFLPFFHRHPSYSLSPCHPTACPPFSTTHSFSLFCLLICSFTHSARKAGTAPEGMAPAKTGIPLAASQPLPMRPPPWALHMWSQARPASQHTQDAPLGLSRTLSDVALDRAMASMYSRMRLVQLSLDKGGDAEQAEWEEYVSVRLVAVPGVTLDDLTGLDAVSLSRGRARVPSSLAIAHVRVCASCSPCPPCPPAPRRSFLNVFQESGLPLWLRPYEILVTSGSTALIETITDAISLHALKSRNSHIKSLRQYFCEKFKHGSPEFRVAQQNFVESMAAYSVVCYLLQVSLLLATFTFS